MFGSSFADHVSRSFSRVLQWAQLKESEEKQMNELYNEAVREDPVISAVDDTAAAAAGTAPRS